MIRLRLGASEEYKLTIDGFTGITPIDPFTLSHPLSGRKFTTFVMTMMLLVQPIVLQGSEPT